MIIIGTPKEMQTFREGCNGTMCNNCALDGLCSQKLYMKDYSKSEIKIITEFLDKVTLARENYIDVYGTIHTTNRLTLEKPEIKSILITNKEVQK